MTSVGAAAGSAAASPAVSAAAPRPTFGELAARHVAMGLVLFPILAVVRAYEFVIVNAAHVLPPGLPAAYARGLRADALLTLIAILVLATPCAVLGLRAPRTARRLHQLVLTIVALSAVALAQYFAVTLVPLGADLFGYTWNEIVKTAASSTSIGPMVIIPAILGIALTWLAIGRAADWRPRGLVVAGVLVLALLSVSTRDALALRRNMFASDVTFRMAENKIGYLAGSSLALLGGNEAPPDPAENLTGYPLAKRARYEDVLGPHMRTGAVPPNIVFVIVEGLGRDFVGSDAPYHGFTPFLDSLGSRSLYWESFLSTSGRTFGILPALLGSLPHADAGFMGLGTRMPRHQTLVTLLKSAGYRTSYYTGTAGSFDRIDVFLERQGIDRFIDESNYGPGYERAPADRGFSWGYPDDALFKRSLQLMADDTGNAPRFDVYRTATLHEPFIPPNADHYERRFRERLNELRPSAPLREVFERYRGVFMTLLYVDDAIQSFITASAARPGFDNTIFIITGDHRLIPVPEATRLSRYHVPFMIYSPMLTEPKRYPAVSSHMDVVPSVLGLLQRRYGLMFPDTAAWLGHGLDTSSTFRNRQEVALMRTKNILDEFLSGLDLLSRESVFGVDSGLVLNDDPEMSESALRERLARYRRLTTYVVGEDRILPPSVNLGAGAAGTGLTGAELADDSVYVRRGLRGVSPGHALVEAQRAARAREYGDARSILRVILRENPNHHDSRAMLGRTYSWQRRFTDARRELDALIRRAPDYAPGHVARIEVEIFSGNGREALRRSTEALERFPRHPELLFVKARALEQVGRRAEALATLNTLQEIAPGYEGADLVRARLTRNR